jgi:Flp pilus assembly protein TadG
MHLAVHRLHRLWADRSGASALEFGILLPVFLLLIFAIIQFGQLFWTQTALQHAVDMAARCATINATACGTPTLTKTYAATQAYGLTFPTGTFAAATAACGNQVTATYSFAFVATTWFPAAIDLSARSCYPA